MSQISTIAEIAAQSNMSASNNQFISNVVGCIIDITQPLFREKQSNYMVQLKIIDQTFNQLIQTNYFIKYLSVYLITENIEEIKLKSKIGDLVYLHKFHFSNWNQIKLVGKTYGSFQCFYQIQSGQIQENQSWILDRKLGKDDKTCDIQMISVRIAQIKNWIRLNFANIFRPFIGVKIINNYCSLIEPFSMIVKVKKVWKTNFQHNLFAVDLNDNSFYLDLKPFSHLLFKQNEWVYLRGVKQINTDKRINFIDTGRVIQLPQIFAQLYEQQSNYKAIYRKTNKLGTQKKQTSSLTYITLFDQKVSTVKELYDLQDKYKSTMRKQDIILQNNYLVKGAVIKYTGSLKIYHTQYQMIIHDKYLQELPNQQKKSTIDDKKLVYLYEGIIYLADRSINSKRQCLKIVLFTNQLKSTFFDQKELQKLTTFIGFSDVDKKKQKTLSLIHSKLEKLKQLSSFQNPAALVLEPIRSDQLIFRLINTKII